MNTEDTTPLADKNILDSPWLKEYLTFRKLLKKIEDADTHDGRVDAIRVLILYILIVPDFIANAPTFRGYIINNLLPPARIIPELVHLCTMLDEMLETLKL
jgi:hypothetical protein